LGENSDANSPSALMSVAGSDRSVFDHVDRRSDFRVWLEETNLTKKAQALCNSVDVGAELAGQHGSVVGFDDALYQFTQFARQAIDTQRGVRSEELLAAQEWQALVDAVNCLSAAHESGLVDDGLYRGRCDEFVMMMSGLDALPKGQKVSLQTLEL